MHQDYLTFDSNFECGNLNKVFAISSNEYNLYVNSDTNNISQMNWFYFKVSGTKKNTLVKFHVQNLKRQVYFIQNGMKPLIFSEKDYIDNNVGWTYKTTDVEISKNNLKNVIGERFINPEIFLSNFENEDTPRHNFYTLSFAHTFKYDNDIVYFALHRPYSFSRLNNFLIKIEEILINKGCKNENINPINFRINLCYYDHIKRHHFDNSKGNKKKMIEEKLLKEESENSRLIQKSHFLDEVLIKNDTLKYKRVKLTNTLC